MRFVVDLDQLFHRDVCVNLRSRKTSVSQQLLDGPEIAAARQLGLPVILVARPEKPAGECVATPEAALEWLAAHAGAP